MKKGKSRCKRQYPRPGYFRAIGGALQPGKYQCRADPTGNFPIRPTDATQRDRHYPNDFTGQ